MCELSQRFVLGVVPLAVFAVLAGAQFAVPVAEPVTKYAMPHNVDRALAMDDELLPPTIQGAQRISFSKQERDRDDVFGRYSRVYEYRDGQGNTYTVSCDFPLEPGGHELTLCYQGIGWNMTRRDVRAGSKSLEDANSPWGYAEANFTKPDGSTAFLAFCSFDEHGSRITPQGYSLWADAWRTLRRSSERREFGRSYTVQVWTITAGKVDEEQKRLSRELLVVAREQFWNWIAGGTNGDWGEPGAKRLK